MPYALQSLFILLGPILFAASTYMVLGRIILAMGGDRLSVVPTRWLTKLFVVGDVLCFVIQAGGGGILSAAKSESTMNLGNNVILTGLIVQVVVFGFFIVCTTIYHYRALRLASPDVASMPWERLLMSLYAICSLIMLRNLYRIIEYGMGRGSYFQKNEWTLYTFDATLMSFVMVITVAWYHSSLRQIPFVADQEQLSEFSAEHKLAQ
jgi:hypothetical protein